MTRKKCFSVYSLFIIILFSYCLKPVPAVQTKGLQYTITGNFSGTLYASYTSASGGTNNEQITLLPWNTRVEYGTNVTAAVIAVSGNAGIVGQQITVIAKKFADYSSIQLL